jgi:hypothetical protein
MFFIKPQKETAFYILLAAIGLVGFVLILVSTPQGVSTSPDSIRYLIGSRNLLAGKGYTSLNDRPIALWPPLYPLILSVVYKAGDLLGADLNILKTLRVINATTLAAIIVTAGMLFKRYIHMQKVAILATVAVALSYPIIFVSSFAWSEPLFILLCLLFFLLLPGFLETRSPRTLVGLVILAALAPLQRYVGILLIGVGCLSILLQMRHDSLRTRFGYAFVFGLTAGLPIALFMARNYDQTGTFAGPRRPSSRPLRTNISHTYTVLKTWFIPDQIGIGYFKAAFIAAVVFGIWGILYYRRYRRKSFSRLLQSPTIPFLLWIVIYPAFFIISETLNDLTPINDRYLAPMAPFLFGLVFMGVDTLVGTLRRSSRPPWLIYIIVGAVMLWLLYPISRLNTEVKSLRAFSEATQLTYSTWRENNLIRTIKAHPIEGEIYTNAPMPVLLHTGLAVHPIPGNLDDWNADRIRELSQEQSHLLWFNDLDRCDLSRRYCIEASYTPEDLMSLFDLVTTTEVSDGTLYDLSARGK